jgi:putative polyketide hydroxylase
MTSAVDSFDDAARADSLAWVLPVEADIECDVLVVGAGPVGLTLGVLLSRSLVNTVVIERHPSVSLHPKARGVFPRTMEILRQINVAHDLVDISRRIVGDTHFITRAESLASQDHHRIPIVDEADLRTHSEFAATLGSQDVLERLLLRRAKIEAMPVHFCTELMSFEQHDDHVRVTVRSLVSGATSIIKARYVVGCDGSRSVVRQHLGVGFSGESNMGRYINVLLDADLAQLVDGRQSVGYMVGANGCSLMAVDNQRRWLLNVPLRDDESYDDAGLLTLARDAIGRDDLDITVISAVRWSPTAMLADRYRVGRVLLAGDAAHVAPPAGATGMNTGIQDAHNLAWKLTAVLNGQSVPDLLDTYEAERRPIAARTVAVAADAQRAATAALRQGSSAAHSGGRPPANLGLTLGYTYSSAAVIDADEGPAPDYRDDVVISTGRPGERTPHMLAHFGHGNTPISGLVGPGWALVGGAMSTRWIGALSLVPLISVMPPMDPDGLFEQTFGVSASGVVLIRPDNVVCWRQAEWSDDGPERLRAAYRSAAALV